MPDRTPKHAILSALQREPDLSALATLAALRPRATRDLLRWLDQSGLALIFLRHLQIHDATSLISDDLRIALTQRTARNAERFRDMLEEFQRLADAFRDHGVFAVTLKGFTLAPDFCEDLSLRHQTDFDFLVIPENVQAAAETLQSCGYSTPLLSQSAESSFTTPLLHAPSRQDELYSMQHHRQVDLHTSIWENSPWLTLNVPGDCMNHAEPSVVSSVRCFGLSLEDKFLLHVLHVFRHSFRFWIRLSWLLEIVRCIELHREEESLWLRVIRRAGDHILTKRIFVFVLGLANRLFGCSLPLPLLSWSSGGLTYPMRTWLDHFSVDWAISDLPGSLKNLFLTGEFIHDRKYRLHYLRSRLLPRRGQTSVGEIAAPGVTSSLKWKSAQLRYLAHRSAVHGKDLLCLPWQHFRWWKALMLARINGIDVES
jgi:putative nucleotidyltransferase-like protein